MTFPVLYVAVRDDLNSMNDGKAEAHSGHASSAFSFNAMVKPFMNNKDPDDLVEHWMTETDQGFGTQINLKMNYKQIQTAVEVAKSLGFMAEMVTDPSYPYEVPKETAKLIPIELDSVDKNGVKIPRIYKKDTVVLFRVEETAGYVFGDKDDPMLGAVMGKFGLK